MANDYVGFFINGERRGEVVASRFRELRMLEVNAGQRVSFWRSLGSPTIRPDDFTMKIWLFQKILIGNRMYGAWMKSSFPSDDDYMSAILTLVDMDPSRARECEIGRR